MAEEAADRRRPMDLVAGKIELPDGVVGGVSGEPIALFRRPPLLVGPGLFLDILGRSVPADDPSALVAARRGAPAEHAIGSIGDPPPAFDRARLAGRQPRAPMGHYPLQLVGTHGLHPSVLSDNV